VFPTASERRICRVLGVSRSGSRPTYQSGPGNRSRYTELEVCLRKLIQAHPTFGYRRLWALLRFKNGYTINVKTVHRLIRKNGWQAHNRAKSAKPRVKISCSRTAASNERWMLRIFPAGVMAGGIL